jgi:putative ABC transport system permease protein
MTGNRIIFFFRFFMWFSLRNIRKHPGRALTVLFGIALGAAVFTSVRLSIHASLDSFSRSMDLIAGQADRALSRPGGRVPEHLLPDLLRHPAVSQASALLKTYIRPAQQGSEPFLLIGVDPILDRRLRSWQVDDPPATQTNYWLDILKEPYSIIVGQPLADKYNWRPGGFVALEHTHQTIDFRIVASLVPQGLGLVEGGRVALTDIATFQEFTGTLGEVDRIDLLLQPGFTDQDLDELQSLLPGSVVMGSPSATKESGQGMIRAYQLNLSILSFASLFVGMFLVYSLVALNAASRRHELAVLRSTGASPDLLFLIFLAEGAVFGLAGWIVAIPFSSLLIKYLIQGISQTISTLFVRVQVDALSLSIWEIGLSFAVTVLIAVLAALQPAREAMLVSPKEALEISQHGVQKNNKSRQLALGGLLCIVLVVPLSSLPGVLEMPLPGYIAILLLFVGFALLAPWFLNRLGDTLSPLLRRAAGTPAYLAGRYIRDSGTRTAVSVGALITAVALFASLVIMIYSFRQTVEAWTNQTVSGDLFLTTKLNEINEFRHPISHEAAAWFQDLDEPLDIVPNRRYFLRYNGFPYEFEILDLDIFLRYADFFWMIGAAEDVRPRLKRGEGVGISEVFSNLTGLTIGDTFRARVEDSFVELPVIAIVRDYRTQGGVVFYSLKHFEKRFHEPRWSGLRFFFKDRHQNLDLAVSNLRKKIIGLWGDELEMISGRDLRGGVLRVFDETFAVTTVLLLIALVIAALGITTTLTVMVLERSRQLNTLFALGGSFGQIRKMIFWEAAFLVAAGEVAGIVCGFILSYLLVYVINRQSFGWTFLYGVDWWSLAMSLPLIVLTALAAAVPAIRFVFLEPPATLLRER